MSICLPEHEASYREAAVYAIEQFGSTINAPDEISLEVGKFYDSSVDIPDKLVKISLFWFQFRHLLSPSPNGNYREPLKVHQAGEKVENRPQGDFPAVL